MISREPAGPERPGRGGDGIAEGDGAGSLPQTARRAKISAGALQAERSRRTLERYVTALRILAARRPAELDLPPDKVERAIWIIEPRLLPGSPAHAAADFVLRCRAPRSFARWLRRNPDLLAAVRREAQP